MTTSTRSLLSSARLIESEAEHAQAPLVRTVAERDPGHGEVVAATLEASGLGLFEPYLNGQRVGADLLCPGWSSYEWRVRVYTYDVTAHLTGDGPVVLGFQLGRGWAVGRLGFQGGQGFYAQQPAVIAELRLRYADGHEQLVATGPGWQSGPSPVLANDLYDGETIDARVDVTGWCTDPSPRPGWGGVREVDFDHARLVAYTGPRVVRHEQVSPVRTWQSPSGKTLVDFGQNLVGWVQARICAPAGTEITLRHAEVLEHDEIGTRPLRSAKATDRFICSGGDDVFEPTLTFHGFRYVEVTGWPGTPTEQDLTAVVIHSDLRRTGHFECSNELVSQLHRNVVWGQKGNFVDLPTDCPQRDERLGWTGDISAFAPTAAFLFDVSAFLGEWLENVAVEQAHHGGIIPYVVPDVLKLDRQRPGRPPESTCLWSDAGCWVPWALWQAYGDLDALRRAFPVMTSHLDHVETLLTGDGLWEGCFQFADWLDPSAPPEDPAAAKADKGVVATACLYRSAVITTETATLLGETEAAERYRRYADRLRQAFGQHYVCAEGTVRSDCPTVYALAICFGLLTPEQEQLAGRRLAELVAENQYRIATGFAGTPFVLPALTRTGHLDEAYRLLLERENPSWLYPVTMGATTVWERWDSMLPDGSINPGEMTSFNHYALGAVADWLHQVVGGLAPLEPGYRRVLVAPRPGGGLTWATTSLDTPSGTVSVHWRTDAGRTTVDVVLPDGVTGELRHPDGSVQELAGSCQVSLNA